MNTYAHIAIGSMIQYALADTDINLIKPTFLYGCIAPDFWPAHLVQPHDNKFCLKQTADEAKILELIFTPAYSINAGIACHYLCDYFCGAHNTKHHKAMKHHEKYERMLDKYIHKHEYRLYAKTSRFVDSIPCCADSIEMIEKIKEMKKEYNQKEASFKKDTSYAIRACLTVIINAARCARINKYTQNIIRHSMEEFAQQTAC